MLFNSFVFWGFFAIVLLLYRLMPHVAQNRLLLVASYVFYGYWDWRFLSLIIFSTVVDFLLGRRIAQSEQESARRALLTASIVINLTFLGFFKYFGFFVAEFNDLLQGVGINTALPLLNIVLPVGISFYTFQSLSYTFDIYRRHTEPASTLADFALFVAFFPQLVAGPIERSGALLPQVLKPRLINLAAVSEGIYLVMIGLVKKVVIADNMAVIVNDIFGRSASTLTGIEVLIGSYAFAFQIYGDFSGYSNIAQGLARILGFRLRWNFRMPYFSQSPSDFWRRWHISLSSWLRDYLYIPLGGNQSSSAKTYRNLALTMVLGGLWHGAAWTFVIWGAFHGTILVVYRLLPVLGGTGDARAASEDFVNRSRATVFFRIVLMFHLVCFSWLLFRAQSMEQVGDMLSAFGTLTGAADFSAFALTMLAVFVVPMLTYEWWLERRRNQLEILTLSVWPQTFWFFCCLIALLIFPPLRTQAFIYFQF